MEQQSEEYISSSLSPAKVIRVDINEEEKSAKVTVPDFQLSLAIGKEDRMQTCCKTDRLEN